MGLERTPQHTGLHLRLYEIAFLEKDEEGMAEQIAYAIGRPRDEAAMLLFTSRTASFYGKRAEAEMLLQRAMISAGLAGQEEMEEAEDTESYEMPYSKTRLRRNVKARQPCKARDVCGSGRQLHWHCLETHRKRGSSLTAFQSSPRKRRPSMHFAQASRLMKAIH